MCHFKLVADMVGVGIREFVNNMDLVHSIVKKYNAFYIWEMGQILSKRVNGHRSICTVVNCDLPVPIHTQSHQLPFQEFWSIRVIHKLPDATPTVSTTKLKWHINLYLNPVNLPESIFDNFTRPPPLLLPYSPLAAPANTLVSLQL